MKKIYFSFLCMYSLQVMAFDTWWHAECTRKAMVANGFSGDARLATQVSNYITDFIKPGTFSITEEEFGVIPMTNFPFSKGEGNIVNIGTAGGQTKPSSGFTFRFIQKHTAKIINALVTGKDPHIQETFRHRRFNLYDSVLLHILQKKKMGGDKIFADLFKKNPPQRILRFLDNETNASEELKIMKSVSSGIFLPVVIKELMR